MSIGIKHITIEKLYNIPLKKLFDVSKYYEELRQLDNVIFSYKGEISSKMMDEILELTEAKLTKGESQVKIRRRVHIIAVEILQNVYHHSESSGNDHFVDASVIFVLGRDEESYFVQAGNFIPLEKAAFLKEKIDFVNTLTNAELKSKYREILSDGNFSEQGGAGLGIVDIARKSGQRLTYKFVESDGHQVFFELKINVPVKA